MDAIDSKLIRLLSANANVTGSELAGVIGLSIPAVNKRIAKMVESGLIDRYTVIMNPNSAGKPLMAMMLVVLERLSNLSYLMECINGDQDILECYAVAGEYDYILKICAKDMMDLEEKICKIKEVRGVVKTNSIMVLCTHKQLPSVLPDEIRDK